MRFLPVGAAVLKRGKGFYDFFKFFFRRRQCFVFQFLGIIQYRDNFFAAYRLMTGKLSKAVKDVQNDLKTVLTGLVAVLDYPEELEDETLPSTEKMWKYLVRTLEKMNTIR